MQPKEVIFQEWGRRVVAFPEPLNPQVTLQGWPLPLLMQKCYHSLLVPVEMVVGHCAFGMLGGYE